jgi:hypothetical protein
MTADAWRAPFRVATLPRHGTAEHRFPQREWTRWATALASTPNTGFLLRSKRTGYLALRHDRRRSFALAFADASAAGDAHRDESCNQYDQKLFHLAPLF